MELPSVAVSEPPDQERPSHTGEACLDGDWDFVGNANSLLAPPPQEHSPAPRRAALV
jgi:hypothetical protein